MITSDIKTAFAEVKKLNLSHDDYIAVINIIADYSGEVRKDATQDAIKILNR
jgi:hypothetical protein